MTVACAGQRAAGRSVAASTTTRDTVVAAAITSRPLPAPAPAVAAGVDGDHDGDAHRAPLAPEDADLTPSNAPTIPARGFLSPLPAVPSVFTVDVASARG